MGRKYLNDIGVKDTIMDLTDDPRKNIWEKEIKKYGFAAYETWAMDCFFYAWLYERLKMFLEVNCIDLNYHKFEYEGKEYTQLELINKMIYGCEVYFKNNYDDLSSPEEDIKAVNDIAKIWAIVLPAMWW